MEPIIDFELLKEFCGKNGKVYIVGGLVRKILDIRKSSFEATQKEITEGIEIFDGNPMEQIKLLTTHDIDICVTVPLEDITQILNKKEIKCKYDSFEKWGKNIIYFKYNGYTYDVTSITTPNDDLNRDITYNSVFYDVFNDQFIDPLYGIYDYCNGIVKHVADFNTCPKHILRVLRFVAEYNHTLDTDSENHLKIKLNELEKVSKEFISETLLAVFRRNFFHKYLQTLYSYNVLQNVFPNIKLCVDNYYKFESIECNLAYLFRYLSPNEFDQITKRLVINKVMLRVKFLIFRVERFDVENLLKILGEKKYCEIKDNTIYEYIDVLNLDPSIKNLCVFVYERNKELYDSLKGSYQEKLDYINQLNIDRFKQMVYL